ncbi:MAG: glycosyl hydrolase 2 galactose-binding domain-containing protein, partial [Acidimicrobiales bacterium]
MAAHEHLTTGWRAAPVTGSGRRGWANPGFDDAEWAEVTVPGHWRRYPGFASCDGPVAYRVTFDGPSARPAERWWLTFEGIFYRSRTWLDGTYLGATEGYFAPHTFEVTDHLAARRQHTLAVLVDCPPVTDPAAKEAITGVFQHWDCLDPAWNPGGIWRPVRLDRSGRVRITRLRALCPEAGPARA